MFSKEQAKKHLISLGIAEPTEEQIASFLNTVNQEIKKTEEKTAANKEEIERLKAIEIEYETEKAKNMSAEERAKKLEAAMQKQTATAREKEVEFAKKISRLTVENILKEKGLNEEDYSGFIDGLISEDEEESKSRAMNLANVLSAKLETQKQTMNADFEKWKLENTPNPNGVSGGGKSKANELAEKLAKEKAVAIDTKILDYYTGGKK